MRKQILLAAAIAGLCSVGQASQASNIPITNNSFETPYVGGYLQAIPTGWTLGPAANDGIIRNTAYNVVPNSPADGEQSAYINDYIAAQIGTLDKTVGYTITFDATSVDAGTTSSVVRLVDGSPSGLILAEKAVISSPNGVAEIHNVDLFTPTDLALGTSGDNLYVEFAKVGGGQSGIDLVTASVPEPASVSLLGLAGAALLARRRRSA